MSKACTIDNYIEIPIAEYNRLMALQNNDPKHCQGLACPFQLIHFKKKFSWGYIGVRFFNLVTSPELWIFVVYTWQIHNRLIAKTETVVYWIMYSVIGLCFMFFHPLSNLLFNGKLNVDAKVAATASVNTDIKKTITDIVKPAGN